MTPRSGEQRGRHAGQGGHQHQALARGQDVGVQARPAHEEVALRAGGLQRLDRADAVHRCAGEVAFLPEQPAVGILPRPRREQQHGEVDRRDADGEERQPYVVGRHDRRVEPHRRHVDHVDGQLVRQQPGDRIVRRDPVHEVARPALAEERHRQRREVPEEARGHQDGELRLHPGEERPLQPDQGALQPRGRRESDQQGEDPVVVAEDQHVVDEHAGHRRHRHARDEQRQRGHRGERERPPGVPEPRAQPAYDARLRATFPEVRARGEGQADARVAVVELAGRDPPGPVVRVVDVEPVAPNALQHDEVAAAPVEDHGEGQLEQRLPGVGEASRHEPVLARRTGDARRVRAVARHAAPDAQLLERHPPAVVGEDHGEAGGTALRGLHLQDGRHPPPTRPASAGDCP